jgi:PAS domain S-box-containing protein
MLETPRARLVAYSVAVLAPALSLLVRWPLWPVLGDTVPHMTFFPAVMIAAYFGGFWPGLLATILSAVAANYFLTEQLSSFQVKSVNDVVGLILFVLVGAIISGLCESLHRAQRRIVAHARQRAEAALVQERYLLHALMDNLPDNIYFKDAASRFLRINKALTTYFGLSDPAQAIGKTDFDFFTEEHARPAYADEQEIIQSGQPVVGKEEKETWLDGRVRWVSTTRMPLRDKDGTIIGTFGVARDITKVKLAEEALRESEYRWRSLTEALPQLVWSATPDGACDYFSKQWTQHTGVPESQLLGWRWLAVLHPDDRGPTRRLWTDSVAGRGPYDVEYRVRRSDGVYRWFKTRGVPIRDGAGNIFKWFGTCTDITDLKCAEEALRESEERYRGTFENAAVGIAHIDVNGRFLRVNEKLCDILGYGREELLAKTFQVITCPNDLAADLEQFVPLLQGDLPSFSREKRYIRKDGSLVWVALSVSLQRDAAGQPANTISIVQDISERKRLEEELRQAKEAAEAANRAKDEFLANVSHEIRTPMNAILGMTDLTLDTPLTEDQRQCLRTVKSAADNLLGIINDLLDFSKIEAGKLELDPADFSLRAALGDTLRALAVRAHRKGLELVCHVQPDVPDALVGDPGRLRQILLNLVGNAIKFTDDGEVVVTVKSEIRKPKAETPTPKPGAFPVSDIGASDLGFVADFGFRDSDLALLRFTVRDTGIGIPQDRQERIFRAFEQEDSSTTRKYGGTGLGLTIAARLVALMGGTINVESELGRGSSFAFTAHFGRQPHAPEPVAALPPPLLKNLPVLIVDDNATNRRILEEWLRGWQMKPVAVGDGVAAMDALWHSTACGRPYPLVLLDARMPDVDGLALAAHIRQRAELSATRIILLTSGDHPGDLARCREQRVNAHLLKPVQQDELLETIYRVMSRTNGNAPPAARIAWGREPVPAQVPAVAPLLRILVAEDNEFNAQLLEQLLVRRGHRVRLANNGREALSLLGVKGQRSEVRGRTSEVGSQKSEVSEGHTLSSLTSDVRPLTSDFDLLLLDVHMPELDGFQVVQAVRERERNAGGHLPVIALTARSRNEDRERCLAAGMDDFLAKPIQAADLWAAIDRVVRKDDAGRTRPEKQKSSASGSSFNLHPSSLGDSLLDPHVLLAACGGDAVILENICQAFRAGLPDHLTAVQNALRERDTARLREAAHKLCGMVAAFSTVAGGVASDLEDHAAQGQLEEARPLVGQLETMADELVRLASGLSLETLQPHTGPADDANRATGP